MSERGRSGSVAYVGPFRFPDGGAAARRILGNALSLHEAGYQVTVASGQVPEATPPAVPDWLTVVSLGERTAEHLPRWRKHLAYTGMGTRTVQWLEAAHPRPDAIILYSGYTPYLRRLLPWCRTHHVPLIFDAVEWYQPCDMPGGPVGPYRWNIELAMRHYSVRTDAVIAISKYLEAYYRRRGCRAVRLPPTLDTRSIEPRYGASRTSGLLLGYAASAVRRDDPLDSVVESLLQVDQEGHRARLVVVGLAPEALLRLPALARRGYRSLPGCVEARGKVPHEKAVACIRSADFSVLLRPQLRYAQAGFPTKVVESMAAGTPIMTNLTSDLANYISDGQEGLICTGSRTEAFRQQLDRALNMSEVDRQRMRRAARSQAERSFDYRNYTAALSALLDQVRRGRGD